MNSLAREIHRFDPDVPIERAHTPPASWYIEPEVWQLERRAVFGTAWQPVALPHQLSAPGSFVTGCFAGEPWVVVRDGDALRAFSNVCRHKAAPVAEGVGVAKELRCRYHGWSYGLDGRLARAPRIGGIEDFDRATLSLRPMAVQAWGPLVWLNPDPTATALEALFPELDQRLTARRWGQLNYAGQRRWTIGCNWKVFVDNYLDGGYHISNMHPSLDAQLDMSTYRTEIFASSSVQISAPAHGVTRTGGGAVYGWMYPNVAVNRYGDALDVNWVVPRGPDRMDVVFHFWFEDVDGPEAAAAIAASKAQTAVTQEEDIQVSEWVQAGLASRSFETGRYAPRVEAGEHHFHRLLAKALRRGLTSS